MGQIFDHIVRRVRFRAVLACVALATLLFAGLQCRVTAGALPLGKAVAGDAAPCIEDSEGGSAVTSQSSCPEDTTLMSPRDNSASTSTIYSERDTQLWTPYLGEQRSISEQLAGAKTAGSHLLRDPHRDYEQPTDVCFYCPTLFGSTNYFDTVSNIRVPRRAPPPPTPYVENIEAIIGVVAAISAAIVTLLLVLRLVGPTAARSSISDAKWRRVFAALDIPDLDLLAFVKFKDFESEHCIQMPRAAALYAQKPFIDTIEFGPMPLRSIEWLELPSVVEPLGKARHPHDEVSGGQLSQDLDKVQQVLVELGRIPFRRTARGLRIVARPKSRPRNYRGSAKTQPAFK